MAKGHNRKRRIAFSPKAGIAPNPGWLPSNEQGIGHVLGDGAPMTQRVRPADSVIIKEEMKPAIADVRECL
jgi:hypothetical protein